MKSGLQKVAFPRIFRVKELEQIEDEWLIDVSLRHVSIKIWTFDESKEEFVNDLQVWPCQLKNGFVLFWVKGISSWVYGGRYRAKEVGGKHIDHLWVYVFSYDTSLGCNVLEHLV